MENVKGPTLPESQRTAFDVLRPIVRLLRASGIPESTLRSASERAYRRYARTPARGVWLDRSCISELARAVRVWARDPEFIDETGSPMRLSLGGGPGSFGHLLRKSGTSAAAERALEQLQALGSVQRCDRGHRVRLVSTALLAVMDGRFLAAPALDAIRRLAETVEHNLCARPGSAGARMHCWADCGSLDSRQLVEVQRFVRSSGQVFLDTLDDKLLSCARRDGKGRLLYGVGIYVFVDKPRKASSRRARRRCAGS